MLHPETEAGDGEMVVVGVVLNSKQTQNEEVSKALEMLRRNGVNCVCFKLNDTLQNGEKKGTFTHYALVKLKTKRITNCCICR